MLHSATIPNRYLAEQSSGSALAMSIIFLALILIISTTIYERTNSNIHATSRRINDQDAVRIAEAGIEKAIWCLNNPSNTTDCPNNPNYSGENAPFGQGSFTSSITGTGNSRQIDVTSTISGSGGQTSKHIRSLFYTTTSQVSFQYGMQAGTGGLLMKNNNKITGNVFSNGPVTGTKSLITGDVVLTLGQPAPDQTSNPGVSPLNITELAKPGTNLELAQSFVPSSTNKAYGLDLKVARVGGAPIGTIALYDNNGGQPGSNLYSQNLVAATDAPGWEKGWTAQFFNTSTAPTLTAGTTYWLVITISAPGTDSDYWKVVRDTNDASYPAGTTKVFDGSSWSAANYDSAFQLYVGGNPTTLQADCTGSLCSDGNAIDGNVYAQIIAGTNSSHTTIKQHACYQTISSSPYVSAGNGTDSCTDTGTAPVPCDSTNTIYSTGPYCHQGSPNLTPIGFPLSSAKTSQMESQAEAGGTLTGNQTLTDGQSLGPVKIVGDLTINAASSNPAKLTGTVWVQGNINLNGTMKLDNNYGPNSGTIMSDNPSDPVNSGRIIVGSSGQLLGNSTANTYIMALSLSTSQNESAAAIDVSNNLTAGVVYAANGAVNIKNSADIKEVTAKKIIMQNNTTITYQTGLASVVFTAGPGASWVYRPGTYQII